MNTEFSEAVSCPCSFLAREGSAAEASLPGSIVRCGWQFLIWGIRKYLCAKKKKKYIPQSHFLIVQTWHVQICSRWQEESETVASPERFGIARCFLSVNRVRWNVLTEQPRDRLRSERSCVSNVRSAAALIPSARWSERKAECCARRRISMHDVPAWMLSFSCMSHLTSLTVLPSVSMELIYYHLSTFLVSWRHFPVLWCGLLQKYSVSKNLRTHICAVVNKRCTSYASQLYVSRWHASVGVHIKKIFRMFSQNFTLSNTYYAF